MPVSGPNKEFAYQQGRLATAEILILLKGKYNVERPVGIVKDFAEKWDELEKTLEITVCEMIWQDHMDSF